MKIHSQLHKNITLLIWFWDALCTKQMVPFFISEVVRPISQVLLNQPRTEGCNPMQAGGIGSKTKSFPHLHVGWDQLFELSRRGAKVTHGLTRLKKKKVVNPWRMPYAPFFCSKLLTVHGNYRPEMLHHPKIQRTGISPGFFIANGGTLLRF